MGIYSANVPLSIQERSPITIARNYTIQQARSPLIRSHIKYDRPFNLSSNKFDRTAHSVICKLI
ncbi:MAG: hypothetical protein HC786_11095 [Richelia sp. CSU_2_1]|nr:hypothetical protein [Richelia sp. CSU_2_1]